MSRLLVFFLGTVGCISMCQCIHLTLSEKNIRSHGVYLKSMKIIDGEVADIQDFPYVVSLQYNGTFYGHNYDHFCCGSILNEDWIITSAQCVQRREADSFHARAGSSQYYENGIISKIESVILHPNFNEITRDYDVALIKVTKKFIFNKNIQPISLPKRNEIIQINTNLSIIGWGASVLLGKMSDNLLKSRIQKISDENCQSVYGIDTVTSRMFCVFTRGFGPCVGDSGSPAVYENKIIGLASWSYSCAYQNPTVYAKISSVLEWIEDITLKARA